ncbi:MAG: hypothetical protein IKJ55_05150 [Clostridia bacterium]|nr:hypothetical protein [Clostridia bacterium]
MRPYEYYKGIYQGKVYADESAFSKAFGLCTAYARHLMQDGATLDLQKESVLGGLCQGAELLKPLLKDPFVTEQSIGSFSVKLDLAGLTERLQAILQMYLPKENFYRGILKYA